MSAVASNVRVPFLDLGPSHALVRDDILSDFGALIEANAFINGPHVVAFESAWAAHSGTARCVRRPTVVERGASLGSGAIIMGGVRIGERALVGGRGSRHGTRRGRR